MVKLHFDLFKIRQIAAQLSMDLKKKLRYRSFYDKKVIYIDSKYNQTEPY